VLVVEGEKTADAATIRFKNHVVVTSPGGSNAAREADWSPLKGRRVVIWLDADEPGSKFADAVADLLQAIAISTHVVAILSAMPRGWDLADNVPPG
jgi:DNA primase